MKLVRFELFYSPLCNICPAAKEVIRAVAEEKGIELDEINIISPTGEEKARKYGIKAVPQLVINGKHQISGIPTKEAILRLLMEEGLE
jgi:small redox-active disulfide protein 1